jgi:hypothetical protein
MAAKHKPENPVTLEHAQKFSAAVVFWADVLGMGDWRITVSEKRSTRAVMAEVYKCDLEQRSATIRMGKHFGPSEVTERNLSDTALHECLHIFLHEVIEFAKAETSSPDDISSAEHRVINVLERVLSDASPLGPRG